MRKLLKPIDILRLSLAGTLDVFEDLCDPFGLMSKGCKELYGWVPPRYKKGNYYRTVSRAYKTGDITKIAENGEIYLRLTSQGKEKIKRDFPLLLFQKKRWDRKWRVVFYDILETKKRVREWFREKLRNLGFGMIQRSVWITPHDFTKDLRELVESHMLEEKIFILEGKHLLAGDPKVLARKIWKLDRLNEEYKRIYKEIVEFKNTYVVASDRLSQDTVGDEMKKKKEEEKEEKIKMKTKAKIEVKKKIEKKREKREKVVRKIRSWYLEVLLEDPFLPKELLPDGWMGEKVRREIKKI